MNTVEIIQIGSAFLENPLLVNRMYQLQGRRYPGGSGGIPPWRDFLGVTGGFGGIPPGEDEKIVRILVILKL